MDLSEKEVQQEHMSGVITLQQDVSDKVSLDY